MKITIFILMSFIALFFLNHSQAQYAPSGNYAPYGGYETRLEGPTYRNGQWYYRVCTYFQSQLLFCTEDSTAVRQAFRVRGFIPPPSGLGGCGNCVPIDAAVMVPEFLLPNQEFGLTQSSPGGLASSSPNISISTPVTIIEGPVNINPNTNGLLNNP